MKLFAYRNRDDLVLTNVWEYAKAIGDPLRQDEFKNNNVFYSLNRDPLKRKKMYAKRTPKGFYCFAFFPGEDDEYTRAVERKYGTGGESFTHAFVKEIFLSLDVIKLKYGDNLVALYGLDAVDEYRVDVSGQTYYIDVCIEFKRSEPEFYAEEWNNKVFIEVMYTHKNTSIKEQNLKKLGHGVFEYNASKLSFSEIDIQNKDFMDRVGRKFASFFKEATYLRKIHNPAEESERKMRQLQEEIKRLIGTTETLSNDNKRLKSQLDALQKQIQERDSEIEKLKQTYVFSDTDAFKRSKYWKKWVKSIKN